MRTTVKVALKSLAPEIQVTEIEGGKRCLELLETGNYPHLILLDIMMPDMDGWEVSRKIKENPETNTIPILFLTARSDKMSEEMGKEIGDDYIEKPFNPVDLLKRIRKYL